MGKKKSSGSAKQVNISSQDRQFNSHISYLFKVSHYQIRLHSKFIYLFVYI